jgi:hypothetical protein
METTALPLQLQAGLKSGVPQKYCHPPSDCKTVWPLTAVCTQTLTPVALDAPKGTPMAATVLGEQVPQW